MNEQFKIELKDRHIDLYNLCQYLGLPAVIDTDKDITATVKYSIMIDSRSWGIKDIDISIDSILISGIITMYKEALTEKELELLKKSWIFTEYSETIDIDFNVIVNEKWTITNELSIQKNNGVPENIEIELTAKRITVS